MEGLLLYSSAPTARMMREDGTTTSREGMIERADTGGEEVTKDRDD